MFCERSYHPRKKNKKRWAGIAGIWSQHLVVIAWRHQGLFDLLLVRQWYKSQSCPDDFTGCSSPLTHLDPRFLPLGTTFGEQGFAEFSPEVGWTWLQHSQSFRWFGHWRDWHVHLFIVYFAVIQLMWFHYITLQCITDSKRDVSVDSWRTRCAWRIRCPLEASFLGCIVFYRVNVLLLKHHQDVFGGTSKQSVVSSYSSYFILFHSSADLLFFVGDTDITPRYCSLHQADASAASPVEETLVQRHGGASVVDNAGAVSCVVIDRCWSGRYGFPEMGGTPITIAGWPILDDAIEMMIWGHPVWGAPPDMFAITTLSTVVVPSSFIIIYLCRLNVDCRCGMLMYVGSSQRSRPSSISIIIPSHRIIVASYHECAMIVVLPLSCFTIAIHGFLSETGGPLSCRPNPQDVNKEWSCSIFNHLDP